MDISRVNFREFKKAFLFIIFLINILNLPLLAQKESVTVKGIVTDPSGNPVPFASVALKDLSKGTLTDEAGHFALNDVQLDENILHVQCIGYEKTAVKIGNTITGNEFVRVTLNTSSIEMDEVVVTGKSQSFKIREKAYSVAALDVKQMQNSNLGMGNMLGRVTGVNIREDGGLGSDFKFSINGLSGKQVKFFIDGVPMDNFGSSYNITNIPVNLVERIEVFKGVVPVWLGSDALGGAVNILTNENVGNYLDASYSFGSFNTHKVSVSGKFQLGNTGWIVQPAAFYNFSDNNYRIDDVETFDNLGNYLGEKSFERFHDQYKSAMFQVKAGLEDKKFADKLLLGITFSGNQDNVQHGVSQERVFGKVHTKDYIVMPSLEYKKADFLIKGLSVKSYASFIDGKYEVVDTSSRDYAWDGSFKPDTINPHHGESGWQKTLFSFNDETVLSVNNVEYVLNSHTLNFNYTFTSFVRQGKDPFDPDIVPFQEPNYLQKQVFGLSYSKSFFDKKIKTTLFSKYFLFNGKTIEEELYTENPGTVAHFTHFRKPGFGMAGTFKVNHWLRFKSSYENTYRLPEGDEMFGDGLNTKNNPVLQPEQSYNFNLGGFVHKVNKRNNWIFELNYFHRDVYNLIKPFAIGADAYYINLSKTNNQGIETEVIFRKQDLLHVSFNATYQHLINKTRYDEDGNYNWTYLDRLPNIPYLFGNISTGFELNDLFYPSNNLHINWHTRYVHDYYLQWPEQGAEKLNIPSQLIHSLELHYSMKKGTYNATLGVSNLFDTKAYDNFRVQKPGRAVYIKLRYFLK